MKKALLDAGIGKDIMGSYDNGIYQPVFSVIAKNANLEQKRAFMDTVEQTLLGIVEKGIDKKALEAGINYHEFRFREADFGGYPKGLMYGMQIFDSWLYDDTKPFIHMQVIPIFAFLKEQIGTGYFESLIRKWLLENSHGSVVVVKPERGRTARLDRELEKKLQEYKESLSNAEREKLVQDTEALRLYQESEESKEDQEKIPILAREDISKTIEPLCNEEKQVEGIPLVYHEIETNGIGYVSLLFDLSGVPEEKLPYVGMLQAVLGLIDTEHFAYGELFNEINVHTGGIGTSLQLYPDMRSDQVQEKEFRATFEMRGKALYPKVDVLFSMMREILVESKLGDEKRLKEILAMLKSRLQMSFLSSGHTTAALRALSYSSPISKFKDDTDGIGYYEVVKEIEEHFEERKEGFISILKELAERIFRADNLMVSLTSAEEGLETVRENIRKMKDRLFDGTECTAKRRCGDVQSEDTRCVLHCVKQNEGFKTSSKVQYVARVGNFIDGGASYHGALRILKVILGYDYLWQNIRVKGGAYGCMCSFNRLGEGYLISYRDPNLEKTMEVYEGVVEYLKSFTVNDRDMTKYIIGTMSNMDRPKSPAAKGERSMYAYMCRLSEEVLQKERMEILDAGQEDIRRLAEVVEAVLAAQQWCVIGSEEKIEAQKASFDVVKNLF